MRVAKSGRHRHTNIIDVIVWSLRTTRRVRVARSPELTGLVAKKKDLTQRIILLPSEY